VLARSALRANGGGGSCDEGEVTRFEWIDPARDRCRRSALTADFGPNGAHFRSFDGLRGRANRMIALR